MFASVFFVTLTLALFICFLDFDAMRLFQRLHPTSKFWRKYFREWLEASKWLYGVTAILIAVMAILTLCFGDPKLLGGKTVSAMFIFLIVSVFLLILYAPRQCGIPFSIEVVVLLLWIILAGCLTLFDSAKGSLTVGFISLDLWTLVSRKPFL